LYCSGSLVALIDRFQKDTMILWYCALLQKRILFCGQPANAVGACCLATPLLVAPLTGIIDATRCIGGGGGGGVDECCHDSMVL
jgi:hypothetical protein